MKNPDVEVKNITKNDVPQIVKLGLATKELHLEDNAPAYYSEGDLKRFIGSKNDIYLVAKFENKIAGYLLATFNPFLKEAYLIDVVVKSEYRKKGVATSLMKEAFLLLNKRKCNWIWALVKENNERMFKVLKKKGFSKGAKFNVFYKVAPFK